LADSFNGKTTYSFVVTIFDPMITDYHSDKSKLGDSGKTIFRNKNSTLIKSDISAKIKSIDPYGEIVV